jgi:hypothetical protein
MMWSLYVETVFSLPQRLLWRLTSPTCHFPVPVLTSA